MSVREQIMALTVYDDLEFDLRKICADIAEANEKELLAEIEAIKSCADAFEFDASVRKAIIEKQQAEKAALEESFKTASHNAAFYGDLYLEQQAKQAALIAELRGLPEYDYLDQGLRCDKGKGSIYPPDIERILAKYEEKQ